MLRPLVQRALQLLGGERDGAERRRELVRGARGHRRQRREALLARGQPTRLLELGVARTEGARDPQEEVHDERGGHPERDPHADRAGIVGDREREVRFEQAAEADERQAHQRPRPACPQHHGRERDLHHVEEAERIVRPAREVEQRRQDRHVEGHQQREVPLRYRACGRCAGARPREADAPLADAPLAEKVQLDAEVRDEPERDHEQQRGDRQRTLQQHLTHEDRRGLARDLRPPQPREPLHVDPVALGDRCRRRHGRTLPAFSSRK